MCNWSKRARFILLHYQRYSFLKGEIKDTRCDTAPFDYYFSTSTHLVVYLQWWNWLKIWIWRGCNNSSKIETLHWIFKYAHFKDKKVKTWCVKTKNGFYDNSNKSSPLPFCILLWVPPKRKYRLLVAMQHTTFTFQEGAATSHLFTGASLKRADVARINFCNSVLEKMAESATNLG